MSSFSKKFLALIAINLVLVSSAYSLTIDLTHALAIPNTYNGQTVVAVGDSGLFLDSRTSPPAAWQGMPNAQTVFADYANPAKNFLWTSIIMEINDSTGNATITGTMSNNSKVNDLYSISMSLTGMCVRNGSTCTSKAALPNLDLRAFLENPANARFSDLGLGLNTGFEWSNVNLNVAALPGGPSPAYTGVNNYIGWTMSPHVNAAELYIWSNSPGPGNLYFAAWYQALDNIGRRIAVGDTKSFGTLRPAPPTGIPEPSSLLLLCSGGAILLRRRKKQ